MHANFSTPNLARLLGDAASVVVEPTGEDFAQRLSHWLDAFDAVGLRSAQRAIGAASAQGQSHARLETFLAMHEELQRVRGTLAIAISAIDPLEADDDPKPGMRARVPVAIAAPEFATYRRRHLALQGQMESKVGTLRAQVRHTLSETSSRLAQLAGLDAALEQAFRAREQKLLATVPAFVERRFDALLAAHALEVEASGRQDDPSAWRQPGSWLDTFGRNLREILLSELDTRMQPVTGLIEAFSNEIGQRQ